MTMVRRIFFAMLVPLFLLAVMYLIYGLETDPGRDFTRLGVYPLHKKGVFGIFAHPLVHTSLRHLLANTFPLLVLSSLLFYFYKNAAAYIFFAVWTGCGLITFLIGKEGWHVGASGIIYGLVFFLFLAGILQKQLVLTGVSLFMAVLYGGLVWNMLPFFAKATSSWEGHLGGAVAGVACAWVVYVKKVAVYP